MVCVMKQNITRLFENAEESVIDDRSENLQIVLGIIVCVMKRNITRLFENAEGVRYGR